MAYFEQYLHVCDSIDAKYGSRDHHDCRVQIGDIRNNEEFLADVQEVLKKAGLGFQGNLNAFIQGAKAELCPRVVLHWMLSNCVPIEEQVRISRWNVKNL